MKIRHPSTEAHTTAPRTRAGGSPHVHERGVAPAILWSPADDPHAPPGPSSVRCVLCAHRCLLRPGRRGICGVRENREGELVTLVYGELVAAHLDPIEKKPLFHVLPGSTSYSIATVGCPLRCGFCQNWEIAQAPREGIGQTTFHAEPAEVVASALAAGARSIAYTYVEPTIFAEYLLDVARLARAAGLLNVLVTNGYLTPESVAEIAPWIDAANVDLKGFDDAVYRRICGARLAPVLETLRGLRAAGTFVEVTTLLIPGFTDDPGGLRELTDWVARELGPETPWHVSRFFPAYRFGHVHPTPVETIRAAETIGREAGLSHVYAGNLGGSAGRDDGVTRCARCGSPLIVRVGYRLVDDRLRAGACPDCGHDVPGIFAGAVVARPGAAPDDAAQEAGGRP